MCFLIAGFCVESKRFVCGFNRDEYYARPWAKTCYHEYDNRISGTDLKCGGTWLALNKSLDFFALTNVRTANENKVVKAKVSRGHLCDDFFSSKIRADNWIDRIIKQDDPNYYNLIIGNIKNKSIFYVSKSGFKSYVKRVEFPVCISNEKLGEKWGKTDRGLNLYSKLNWGVNEKLHEEMSSLLRDDQRSGLLPDTGYSNEIENYLSSIFLSSHTFGTVSSTSIIVDLSKNEVDINEVGYEQFGKCRFQERMQVSFG